MLCINPECHTRENSDNSQLCSVCRTPLLVRGRYRLLQPLRPLDSRHSTEVFEVDDLGTPKVMKILNSDRADDIEYFQREVSILQWMNHPGIPKVNLDEYFTVSIPDRTQVLHCLVMEKIEGVNLEKWVEVSGTISQKQALDWLRQLLEILDKLHAEGFFHRDLKPSNIMSKPNGQLVSIDFGSAREMTDTYLIKLKRPTHLKTQIPGITTVFSGGYTPQEQIDGKALPQSDFFALGRTFVYLLTGKHPMELPTNPETGQLKWHNLAPQISPLLADCLDELMALLPRNRPQNSDAILRDLTPNRLFWRRIRRFAKSPRFKIVAISVLVSIAIYRLSFPWIAQYYFDRSVAELQASHLTLARRNCEKALRFNPKDSRFYNNLGMICQRQNEIACAVDNYQKALSIEPHAEILYSRGQLYDRTEYFDRAGEQHKQAIALDGATVDFALSRLARLSILQGNLDRAIDLIHQGLEQTQQPNLRSALYRNLGWIDWIQADYAKAEENLQKALQLQDDRTEAYCLLALVRESQSRETAALEPWKFCRDGEARNRVEILTWQTMARQRLHQR